MKHTLHFLCIPALMFALSCSQKTDKKTNGRPSIIVDKKELECKRKNWNRVHPAAGYATNVAAKQAYKPAGTASNTICNNTTYRPNCCRRREHTTAAYYKDVVVKKEYKSMEK